MFGFNVQSRSLVFLFLGLLFLGPATNVLHFSLVPHSVCHLHGEWEHSDHEGAQVGVAEATIGAEDSSAAHAHEHCEACLRREVWSAVVTATVVPVSDLSIRFQYGSFHEQSQSSLDLKLLSPSNSPPSLI